MSEQPRRDSVVPSIEQAPQKEPLFVNDSDEESVTEFRPAKRSTKGNMMENTPPKRDASENHAADHRKSHDGRPRIAAYHPSFARAESMLSATCTDLWRTCSEDIKLLGDSQRHMNRLRMDMEALCNIRTRYPPVGAVAFLGTTGVGKSSTINSILGETNAARANDGSKRGTWVTHEYRGAHQNQSGEYYVEVHLHTKSNIKAFIAKHLRSMWLRLVSDAEHGGSDNEYDDDSSQDWRYRTALDWFRAPLCEQEDFRDLEQFMIDNIDDLSSVFGPGGSGDIFKAGVDWLEDILICIENLIRQRGFRDGLKAFDVFNGSRLQEYVRDFAISSHSQTERPKASLWPLVDKIIISLRDNDLLNSGAVLLDTPGTDDRNLTVAENTRRALATADVVLVFANVKRIESNTQLDEMLRLCLSLDNRPEIRLVVTCVDQKQNCTDAELAELSEYHAQQIRSARQTIKKRETDVAALEQEKERLDLSSDLDIEMFRRYREVDSSLRKARRALRDAEAALKQLSVTINNACIQEQLKDRLQSVSRSANGVPKLEMFFLSNTEYQKHITKQADTAMLEYQATGVPELKEYLYEVPTIGKLDILQAVSTRRLPTMFKGLAGILDKSTLERKEEVRLTIDKQLRTPQGPSLNAAVNKLLPQVKENYARTVLSAITRNEPDWAREGHMLVDGWLRECKGSAFKAFCDRYGDWRVPKSKEPKKWNNLIRQTSDDVLIDAFEDLMDKTDAGIEAFRREISGAFYALRDVVSECDASQGVPMDDFWTFVLGVGDEIGGEFEHVFQAVQDTIRKIRAHSILEDDPEYITAAMKPAYEQASQETSVKKVTAAADSHTDGGQRKRRKTAGGPKQIPVTQRRAKILKDYLDGSQTGQTIFLTAGNQGGSELLTFLGTQAQELDRVAKRGRDRIMQDFGTRFEESPTEAKDPPSPEAVARIKQAAADALRTIEGPLRQLLQECQEYEEQGRRHTDDE